MTNLLCLWVVLRCFVELELVRDGRETSLPAQGGRFWPPGRVCGAGKRGPPNLMKHIFYSRPNFTRLDFMPLPGQPLAEGHSQRVLPTNVEDACREAFFVRLARAGYFGPGCPGVPRAGHRLPSCNPRPSHALDFCASALPEGGGRLDARIGFRGKLINGLAGCQGPSYPPSIGKTLWEDAKITQALGCSVDFRPLGAHGGLREPGSASHRASFAFV